MGEPSLVGLVHETFAAPVAGVAATLVGASGADAGGVEVTELISTPTVARSVESDASRVKEKG
jgi:hypothetical protein